MHLKKNASARFVRVVALACALCLSAVLMASCSSAQDAPKDPAQLNREYMSSVNRISLEAADDLEGFSEASTQGDLAAMRLAAADASKTLEKISALQAPEDLAEVHKEYEAGVADLNQALSEYLDIYARIQDAGETVAPEIAVGFEAELKEVKKRYESGIAHISKADTMVADMAGGAEDGSGDASNDGAKADANSAGADASADASSDGAAASDANAQADKAA